MTSNSIEPANYPPLPDEIDYSASLPAIKRRGKTKWVVGLLSLLLLTGSGYYVYQKQVMAQQHERQRMAIAPVEQVDLAITISANGTVEPEQLINVSPKTTGILASLLVNEGDFVNQGQVIAQMDDSNLQGQLIQTQGQLAAAIASLEELLAGNRTEEIAQAAARLRSAEASLEQAEDDLRRNQELVDEGAISRQTYNQARTARDTAQAEKMEAEQALLLSQAGARQEDIDQARAQVEAAKGALKTIQTQIDDTVIRAPFSGIVNRKYADPGAFVTPTTAGSSVSSATSSSILSLAAQNQVVANVAESSIAQIQIGQVVVIEADAYPGKTFQGRVSQIATEATVEQNVTSFEVEVALLGDAAQQLRSGMNVSVDFRVGQVQNAIAVPTIAITQQEGVTGVYVAEPNHPPRFTPITTGATVNNRTEVKSGLNGTEHILINQPPQPRPQSGFSWTGLFGGSPTDGTPGSAPPGAPPGGGPAGGPGGGPGGPPPL